MRSRLATFAVLALLVPAASAAAAFPGQNGKIAFVVTPGGCAPPDCTAATEIYSANPDGGTRTNLSNSPGDDRDPAWSADGTKIAFASNRDGNSEIYVMNSDGTGPVRVTNNSVGDFEPSWSPSGAHIVFTSNRDGNEEIYRIAVDGTGETRLTTDPARDHQPDWSPDAERITFTSNRERQLWTDVFTMRSDGSDLREVPLPAAPGECWGGGPDHFHPDWSPRGDKLVLASFGYEGCIAEEQVGRIETVRPDGTDRHFVVDDLFYVLDPVWSPDAGRIAYSYPDFEQIRTRDSDTGASQQTVTTGDSPDWQPLPVETQAFFVRPRGASPFRVPLVPAAEACAAPNRMHGPPLAFGSCSPVTPASPNVTVSQGDARLRSVGSVRVDTVVGIIGPPEDYDVRLNFSLTNVMKASDFTDYSGELQARVGVRRTDRDPGFVGSTTQDFPFAFTVPCAPTPASALDGSSCQSLTSVNAVVPGAIKELVRTMWAFDKLQVYDGGPDGDADTERDNSLFATQGIFVP